MVELPDDGSSSLSSSRRPLLKIYGPGFLISTSDHDGPAKTFTAVVDPPVSGGTFLWTITGAAIKFSGATSHATVSVKSVAGAFSPPTGSGEDQILHCTYTLGSVSKIAHFKITVYTPTSARLSFVPSRSVETAGFINKAYRYQILDQWTNALNTICTYVDTDGKAKSVTVVSLKASEVWSITVPWDATTKQNLGVPSGNCVFLDQMRASRSEPYFGAVQSIYIHQSTLGSTAIGNLVRTNTVHFGVNSFSPEDPVWWIDEEGDSDPDAPLPE